MMITTTTNSTPSGQYDPDDIAIWADGFWASLSEVWNGEFSHRSDDFEIVRLEDVARLKDLGLAEDLEIT